MTYSHFRASHFIYLYWHNIVIVDFWYSQRRRSSLDVPSRPIIVVAGCFTAMCSYMSGEVHIRLRRWYLPLNSMQKHKLVLRQKVKHIHRQHIVYALFWCEHTCKKRCAGCSLCASILIKPNQGINSLNSLLKGQSPPKDLLSWLQIIFTDVLPLEPIWV